jgi:positive regulator of sigma E activity
MLKEVVDVTQVQNNTITIKFTRKQACSKCPTSYICHKNKDQTMQIDRQSFDLKPGDKIEIAIEEKKTILASLINFFIPALLFVLSLIIFKGRGELNSFLGALVVLAVYFVVVKLIVKKKGSYFNLTILQKVS